MKLIDYMVKLIQFPPGKTKEAVTENEDGSYTIFIDASLTAEEQKKKFLHAMSHIIGDDFRKENANEIECNAHSMETSKELCVS